MSAHRPAPENVICWTNWTNLDKVACLGCIIDGGQNWCDSHSSTTWNQSLIMDSSSHFNKPSLSEIVCLTGLVGRSTCVDRLNQHTWKYFTGLKMTNSKLEQQQRYSVELGKLVTWQVNTKKPFDITHPLAHMSYLCRRQVNMWNNLLTLFAYFGS